jgi:hypothetical protein
MSLFLHVAGQKIIGYNCPSATWGKTLGLILPSSMQAALLLDCGRMNL